MLPMSVGISVYDMTASDVRELAVAADAAGFDAVWLGEHVVLPVDYSSEHPTAGTGGHEHITGPIVDPDTELLDPWVALGAVAGATTQLRLATGIYILPLRHPLITARSAATLQNVSGGRLLLGIGAGWLVEEFAALDVPFDERYGRLVETIEIIRAAWAGGPFDYHGKYFSFDPIQLTSRPVDVPLIMGGNTPPALKRAALLGDGWFSSGTPNFDDARRLRDTLAGSAHQQRARRARTAATSGWRVPTRHSSSAITPRASTTSSSGPTSCGRPRATSTQASDAGAEGRSPRPVTRGRPRPAARSAGAVEDRHRSASLRADLLAPGRHPLVGALAADVPRVELLEHDGGLPAGERLIPVDVADVEAGDRRVALDHFGASRADPATPCLGCRWADRRRCPKGRASS